MGAAFFVQFVHGPVPGLLRFVPGGQRVSKGAVSAVAQGPHEGGQAVFFPR